MTPSRWWDVLFVVTIAALWTSAFVFLPWFDDAWLGGLFLVCVAVPCLASPWGIVVRLVGGQWPAQWRSACTAAWASLHVAAGGE